MQRKNVNVHLLLQLPNGIYPLANLRGVVLLHTHSAASKRIDDDEGWFDIQRLNLLA